MFFIDLLAGIFIAALAGLGVGGGGILVIYLTIVKNIPQIESQGINLLFFIAAGASSLTIHAKKRKLNLKKMLPAIIFGAIGAVAGSLLANTVDAALVKRFFGGFLLVSGLIELFSKPEKNN